MKYLSLYLIQGLYAGNYKIIMKKIKEDLKTWRDIPCSWIGKF